MNTVSETLLYNWHPVRIIYMVLSVAILIQAWQSHEWAIGLVGGFFLYQGVFNTGCCGVSGGMRAARVDTDPQELQDTDYTEIK